MIKIYIANISDIDNLNEQKMMDYLSDERKKKLAKFRNKDDAYRSATGELLMKYAVVSNTDTGTSDIVLAKNNFGKPFLADRPDIHFNISHSGKMVVCIFCDKAAGIDIEEIKDLNINDFKQFFSIDEFNAILKCTTEDRQRVFFELWTLKESYLKALGTGFSTDPKSVTISENESGFFVDADEKYTLGMITIDKNYQCSYCVASDAATEKELEKLTINELVGKLKRR